MKPVPVVVFVDIDNTFLRGETSASSVSFADMLAREGISVVLCSSMTRAELEIDGQRLGIRHPFICESGAAILIPHEYFPFHVPSDRELPGYHVIEFGRPYNDVVELLELASTRMGIAIRNFNRLSVEQVAHECGLPLSLARLAKLREYTEPFTLVDQDRAAHDRLWRALRSVRLSCVHRGVLEHAGAPVDTGTTLRVLTALYRRTVPSFVTAGLGPWPGSANLLRRVGSPYAITTSAAEDSAHVSSMPRIAIPSSLPDWVDTIIAVSRCARERRRPRIAAAAVESQT